LLWLKKEEGDTFKVSPSLGHSSLLHSMGKRRGYFESIPFFGAFITIAFVGEKKGIL